MTTCPVRCFTPDVDQVLGWFEVTHDVTTQVGMAAWQESRCVRLPHEGAIADQDSWLWEALTLVRHTQNTIYAAQAKARQAR